MKTRKFAGMATAARQSSAASTPQSTNHTNGRLESPDPILPPAPVAPANKKGKGKKEKIGADETSKLLAAKISQLEQDAAGEKDQEIEIGVYILPMTLFGEQRPGNDTRRTHLVDLEIRC